MRPGPNDPWLKRLELWVRRRVVRAFGAIVHRRSTPPDPRQLTSARVLLIRQDRIGDLLVSTPLISALRQAHPGLVIDILLSTNNVSALPGLPGIGRAWVYERSFWSMVTLLRQVRRQRYDVALDLMDNPSATSTAFCVLSGARWTVGLEKENDYSYDVRVPLRSRRDYHIIERLSPLAAVFGVPSVNAEIPVQYEPTPSARASAISTYQSLDAIARIKIGVNISAGSERRFWGADSYRTIIRRLVDAYPEALVILLCKPGDSFRAREIAQGIVRAHVPPPSPSFDAFAALVAHLDGLITPDTSAVHLASAFQVPSVVMYIQSNPELRIWDPYQSPHEPVVTAIDELSSITPDAVWAAWTRLTTRLPFTKPRSLAAHLFS